MAKSKGISYGRLLVKNLYTTRISTSTQNTQIFKDMTGFRTGGSQSRRVFCNFSGNQELPPPPPPSSSTNWGKWTASGIVVAVVIPLLQFKEDVDIVMETAEEIIDVIEVAAEGVDKVAEKIAGDLADGSKLRATMETIEEVAETVAGKAKKAVDFIDEVQKAEQKLGPIIEPVNQLTQATPSESS